MCVEQILTKHLLALLNSIQLQPEPFSELANEVFAELFVRLTFDNDPDVTVELLRQANHGEYKDE